MPKVVFVNEHRIVEVASGKNLKTLALELGINPHRESFAVSTAVTSGCAAHAKSG